jgi:hypothetical protein
VGSPLETLPSPELLRRLQVLVDRGHVTEAELLAHLGEIDARRLYLEQACSSMFVYCVRVLHFAEGVAYKRIHVARAARGHPELLEAIRRGDLHVTAASLLAAQITKENVRELITAARRRTAEQVRELLADRRPRPDVQASVRRIPDPLPAKPAGTPVQKLALEVPERPPAPTHASARPEPLGDERYCVRFTADRETYAQLQELRALMRHRVPDGDLGKILGRAISALLAQVRKQKLADGAAPKAAKPPSSNPSRSIPGAVRREVFRRDEGRCTYVSTTGRRCGSREFLEFHHEEPWARSRNHPVAGITLRCRAHNQRQAERDFGARHMARFRRGTGGPPRGTGFRSGS